MRLHLGCGKKYLEEYTNIDISGKVDIKADIRYLYQSDCIAEEIRFHHVFEHFSRVVSLGLLIRWTKWLKIGGKIVIEVPDFEGSIRNWDAKSQKEQWGILRHLTGDQTFHWGFHKELWTPDRLQYLLTEMGYCSCEITRIKRPQFPYLCDFIITARKGIHLTDLVFLSRGKEFLNYSILAKEELDKLGIWETQLKELITYNKIPFEGGN